MDAIYYADFKGNSGKLAALEIIDVLNLKLGGDLTSSHDEIGRRHLRTAYHGCYSLISTDCGIDVRFKDERTSVQISGEEGRVLVTKSKLLKLIGGGLALK